MAIIPALVTSILLPPRQALRYPSSFSFSLTGNGHRRGSPSLLSLVPFAAVHFVSYTITIRLTFT